MDFLPRGVGESQEPHCRDSFLLFFFCYYSKFAEIRNVGECSRIIETEKKNPQSNKSFGGNTTLVNHSAGNCCSHRTHFIFLGGGGKGKGTKKRVRSVLLVLDFCSSPLLMGSTWFSKLAALISSLQIHRGGRTYIMNLNEFFFGAKMLRPASPSRETKGEGLWGGGKAKKKHSTDGPECSQFIFQTPQQFLCDLQNDFPKFQHHTTPHHPMHGLALAGTA